MCERVKEESEWESGERYEVVLGPGDECCVGEAVWGVED